jgi:hypothetical protein
MINTDLSKFIDVKVDELSRCKDYPVTLKHDIQGCVDKPSLGHPFMRFTRPSRHFEDQDRLQS